MNVDTAAFQALTAEAAQAEFLRRALKVEQAINSGIRILNEYDAGRAAGRHRPRRTAPAYLKLITSGGAQ